MEESLFQREFTTAENTKLEKNPAMAEEDEKDLISDDVLAWFSGDEDSIGDLTMLLDDTVAEKVKFIENPYSSAMIFQSSSSYITINGNEESCGSSFSDSDSSVMASVDICGTNLNLFEMDSVKWKSSDGGMDGSDGLSWDDDDFARFIGEGEELSEI